MGMFVGFHRKKRWSHRYFLDCGGGPEDCVMLAGMHRSGTTWVMELLNHRVEFRSIFEPFWAKEVPAAAPFNLQEWIPEDGGTDEQLSAARAILSGKVRSRWSDRYNRRRISKRRLVKSVRASFMLGWVRRHFPEMPLIFLVRHPCAVTASVMKMDWGDQLRPIAKQPALHDRFADHMALASSEFEKGIVRWCIENSVALSSAAKHDLPVFYYEHLCSEERGAAADALFRAANIKPARKLDANFDRPSALARQESAITQGKSVLDSWKKNVSTAELDFTLDMLERFELDHIYGEGALPRFALNT